MGKERPSGELSPASGEWVLWEEFAEPSPQQRLLQLWSHGAGRDRLPTPGIVTSGVAELLRFGPGPLMQDHPGQICVNEWLCDLTVHGQSPIHSNSGLAGPALS